MPQKTPFQHLLNHVRTDFCQSHSKIGFKNIDWEFRSFGQKGQNLGERIF